MLSDVLGDPLDVIGSGSTAADPTTFQDALDVLSGRGLLGVAEGAVEHLRRGARGEIEETPSGGEAFWKRVRHVVIGNNALAVRSAHETLESLGFEVVEAQSGVTGEASEVGRRLARRVLGLGDDRRRAMVWGGETTVCVGGASGLGGRSQELALGGAGEIAGRDGVGLIAFGTDGIDGPTDAAGGAGDGRTAALVGQGGRHLDEAMANHDSHRALGRASALIRTGASGTNVNDLMIGLAGLSKE